MRVSDSASKRKSSSMLGAGPPAFVHHPKRSTPKLLNTNINDLPNNLLVEILCRSQDRYELVREYKLVCRRWRNLMSDPYYIRRFLCYKLRREETQQPEPRLTLISKEREQFDTATPYWSSSSYLLAPVFKRLMSVNSLDREPEVVATYNDLVLCCVTKYVQRDYFICNPHTMQWVALPSPPSRTLYNVPVGFICDSPFYYFCEKEKDKHGNILRDEQLVNVNADYRCRVVRVLPYGNAESRSQWFTKDKSFKFKVEIFSFETGKWSESVISSPRIFNFKEINPDITFAYKGMLYWSTKSNANFLRVGSLRHQQRRHLWR